MSLIHPKALPLALFRASLIAVLGTVFTLTSNGDQGGNLAGIRHRQKEGLAQAAQDVEGEAESCAREESQEGVIAGACNAS